MVEEKKGFLGSELTLQKADENEKSKAVGAAAGLTGAGLMAVGTQASAATDYTALLGSIDFSGEIAAISAVGIVGAAVVIALVGLGIVFKAVRKPG